jgi:hypothetical protein
MQYPILGDNSTILAYAAEAAREQGNSKIPSPAFSKYVALLEK